jgi:hypothetical protein
MNIFYLAHGGEEHSSGTENVNHVITENPLIGILVITAVVLIIGALMIWLMGRKATSPQEPHKKKKAPANEPSDS